MSLLPIDPDAFYARYRARWGKLSQSQVDGLNFLLQALEADTRIERVSWAAYMLATVKWECSDTWQPIVETGSDSYFQKYEVGHPSGIWRRLGNTQRGDGLKYKGRGFVQVTGRDNYTRYNLQDHPESALEPDVAYEIMVDGMTRGRFTGKKLGDYLNDQEKDYKNARRIINSLDQWQTIKGYAEVFETMWVPKI